MGDAFVHVGGRKAERRGGLLVGEVLLIVELENGAVGGRQMGVDVAVECLHHVAVCIVFLHVMVILNQLNTQLPATGLLPEQVQALIAHCHLKIALQMVVVNCRLRLP